MSAQIERGTIAAEAIGKHFTTIFNGAIRDPRISWKTKGILAWLLSHRGNGREVPDSFEIWCPFSA